MSEQTARSLWSSKFGFIMATAGAAVGLGNIWKFPYMAGNNGGGIFVLLYLVFIVIIGIPAMIAELMIGRKGRQNPVNCLANVALACQHSKKWQNLGWLGMVTLVMVLSFYSVVAGWSMAYLFMAINGQFVDISSQQVLTQWNQLLASPLTLTLWHGLFMFLTMLVVALGVNHGIERASKWLMPSLFVLLIILVIYAAMEGDFYTAWHYLFHFKWSELTARAVIDAMGQAFFSLATGAGCILIYGSYLSKKTDMIQTVFIISALNVFVALLAGLAIFPLVFANDLAPQGGPGLMFQALPMVFSKMPGSYFISIGFFTLLLFAAWTSSISMAEPLVALLNERWKLSRRFASFIVGLVAFLFGLASVLSFNVWQDVKVLNRFGLFEVLTDLPTNILLPTGAFLYSIFAGWVMPKATTLGEFEPHSIRLYAIWRWIIRYFVPFCILIVFIEEMVW